MQLVLCAKCLQALAMLNKELKVVVSLSSTLSSFKEDPTTAAGGPRAGRGGVREEAGGVARAPRDPDVWPPPTPQEPRCDPFRA